MGRLAAVKDPAAVLDYAVDWLDGGYLGTRTVSTSAWFVEPVEPGGLIVASPALNGQVASAIVSGGVAGHIYMVTNRITTNAGTTEERSIMIRVENR